VQSLATSTSGAIFLALRLRSYPSGRAARHSSAGTDKRARAR